MEKYKDLVEYIKNTKYLIYYIISNFVYEGIGGLKYGKLYPPIRFYDKQKVIKTHKFVTDTFC